MSSQEDCAGYVREALEAGGVNLSHHPYSAKDYGQTLEDAGFTNVGSYPGKAKQPRPNTEFLDPGDVVVIEGFAAAPHGHIAIYTGNEWVSDFVQRDIWSGPKFRVEMPPYVIYRPPTDH